MRRNEFGRHTGHWGGFSQEPYGLLVDSSADVHMSVEKRGKGESSCPPKKKKNHGHTQSHTFRKKSHLLISHYHITNNTFSPSLFIICKMFRISSELSVPCFHPRWTEPSCFSYCSLMRVRASANAQQTAADRVSSTSGRGEIWPSEKCSA